MSAKAGKGRRRNNMTNVEANILGRRPLSLFLAAVLIMAVISVTADGQSKEANPVLSNVRVGAPGIFLQQAEALGLRLNTPGKERTVYSGQLFDQDGKSSPARVIHQMPGLVRLEGFKDGGASLSFDGRQAIGITNRKSDESLIETFLADFPEGLFASVQNGAAVRLIGRGVMPNMDQLSSPVDNIEISSGKLHLQIPLASLPRGKGGTGFDLNLEYDSHLYDVLPDTQYIYYNNQWRSYLYKYLYSTTSTGGWTYSAQNYQIEQENKVGAIVGSDCLQHPLYSETNIRSVRYRLVLPDGSMHILQLRGYEDYFPMDTAN